MQVNQAEPRVSKKPSPYMYVNLFLDLECTCSQGGDYKATCEVSYSPVAPYFIDVVALKDEAMKRMPAYAEALAEEIYKEVIEFCNSSGGRFHLLRLEVTEAEDHGPIIVKIWGEPRW